MQWLDTPSFTLIITFLVLSFDVGIPFFLFLLVSFLIVRLAFSLLPVCFLLLGWWVPLCIRCLILCASIHLSFARIHVDHSSIR